MASTKILEQKKLVVDEIVNKLKTSESVIIFQYQGLTVEELSELRKELKNVDSEVRVYKNTLLKRAADELNLNLDEFLEGPNAILFGKELLEPIKIVSEFAKKHDKLDIRVGVISGNVADLAVIKEYATIPSREGLLTMFAGGLLEHAKNFAICLDLHAKNLEENN